MTHVPGHKRQVMEHGRGSDQEVRIADQLPPTAELSPNSGEVPHDRAV